MGATDRLRGKVCIVTGSSSGIGRAISLAYAREGGLLVCSDLQPEARVDVSAEREANTDSLIVQNGGRAIFVRADVSNAVDMEALVQKAVEEYGRLDVFVNNAGVSLEAGRPLVRIHETSEEVFDITMAINTKSVFLGCKYATAQMLKQDLLPSGDRGWIVNMCSIYGLTGGYCMPAYNASKGAVALLTKQVALDYAASRIHCSAICPGYTDTAIFVNTVKSANRERLEANHPLGIGQPSDLVGAALFLVSDEARWVTGTLLNVDGGWLAGKK
ncbi:unnamed protein product [Clonostachys byssicola]|uniref:Uncharacterized protein n=1 Tax=Clonostachys byssicola TaxID=160290 RepID=A0A9N9XY51_9HYPO|nr:unnamed protein product [Clonostachys byssicola]